MNHFARCSGAIHNGNCPPVSQAFIRQLSWLSKSMLFQTSQFYQTFLYVRHNGLVTQQDDPPKIKNSPNDNVGSYNLMVVIIFSTFAFKQFSIQ